MSGAASRRTVRLRREYLYRRSLEGKEREVYEKKRRVREALAEGKAIPTELRGEEKELRRLLEFDDAAHSLANNKQISGSSIDDEYARTLRGERLAKVCVTTSRDPSVRLKQFAKELKHLVPKATNINRGTTKVADLVDAARRAEFSDLVVVHETRGQPDGLVVSHLPVGPTTYFTLSGCVLRHDVDDAPNYSVDAPPHLIFHNFDDRKHLARRIVTVLKCLFPVVAPKTNTKRVCTFYNQDDKVSFRHHHHHVPASDAAASSEDDIAATETSPLPGEEAKRGKRHRVALAELGPRFDMTPYQIKLGTLDAGPDADVEWVLRPYLNSAQKIL